MEDIKKYLTKETKEKLLSCDNSFDAFLLGLRSTKETFIEDCHEPKLIKSTIINGSLTSGIITIPHTTKGIVVEEIEYKQRTWKEYEDKNLPDVLTGLEIVRNLKEINRILLRYNCLSLPESFWGEDYNMGLRRLMDKIGKDMEEAHSKFSWTWDYYSWVGDYKTSHHSLIPIIDL